MSFHLEDADFEIEVPSYFIIFWIGRNKCDSFKSFSIW